MSDQRLILLGEAQRELVDDLRERGFSVLQERFDRAAFGNYLIDLTTSEFTVRVVRERGRWGIEASVPSWKEWMPMSVWRWIYEGGSLPGAFSNFDQDSAWLRGNIDSVIEELRSNAASLHERLLACGRERLASWVTEFGPKEERGEL